jgi:hypothetical protein
LLGLWHQRPFCERLSQEETILENQIQRFLASTSKTKLLVTAFLFMKFVGMHGLLILELHNI